MSYNRIMRVVVCGIGNSERGDDAFGPYIIEHINESKWMKKIDCGLYPENYLARILSFMPELVIFLDAVAGTGGEAMILKDGEIYDMSPVSVSSHNLSLGAIFELLKAGGVKSVIFFGVPALSYTQYSTEVKAVADRVISVLNDIDKTCGFAIIKLYEALSEQIR